MFGIRKKSKKELSKKLFNLTLSNSIDIYNILNKDKNINYYCTNKNIILNTSRIFTLNLYRDFLNSQYNSKDVFCIIFTTLENFSDVNQEKIKESFILYMSKCNEKVDLFKKQGKEVIDAIVMVYFQFIANEMLTIDYYNEYILNSAVYNELKDYFRNIIPSSNLQNEEYNLKKV